MDFTELLGHWETHHQSLRQMIREEFSSLRADVATLKEILMTLQVDVQNLVDQVAKNTSLEESSALALTGLTAKAVDLQAQIAALQATIAAGGTISPADVAAIQGASAALVQSATDLQAATPAGTGTQPVPVNPPTPAAANPQGARRF